MYLVFAGICCVCAVLVMIAIYWLNVTSGKKKGCFLALWGGEKEKEGQEPLLLAGDTDAGDDNYKA